MRFNLHCHLVLGIVLFRDRILSRSAAFLSLQQIERLIRGDAVEPGGKTRMRLKALKRFKSPQQALLHYFLRVVLIAGHAKRDVEKSATMPVHDDFEGLV